jgi:hypothetical protein
MTDHRMSLDLACEIHDRFGVPVFPVRITWNYNKQKWDKVPLVRWTQVSGGPNDMPWHDANAIGVPTGQPSGLFVIDLDTYKPGTEAEDWFDARDLAATRTHRTASGGKHLIYRLPKGTDLNCSGAPIAGIDLRGSGGFIVWADTQENYRVLDDRMPVELPTPVYEDLKARQNQAGTVIADAKVPEYVVVDDAALDAKLSRALEHPKSGALRRRFYGETAGLKDVSASGRDMSMAALLAHHGFTFDEIVQVLLDLFEHGTAARDGWNSKTERAAKRCAYKALQGIHDRTERRRQAMLEHLAKLNRRHLST